MLRGVDLSFRRRINSALHDCSRTSISLAVASGNRPAREESLAAGPFIIHGGFLFEINEASLSSILRAKLQVFYGLESRRMSRSEPKCGSRENR